MRLLHPMPHAESLLHKPTLEISESGAVSAA
jgi:hypothetical protein